MPILDISQWEGAKCIWNGGANMLFHVHGTKDFNPPPALGQKICLY